MHEKAFESHGHCGPAWPTDYQLVKPFLCREVQIANEKEPKVQIQQKQLVRGEALGLKYLKFERKEDLQKSSNFTGIVWDFVHETEEA